MLFGAVDPNDPTRFDRTLEFVTWAFNLYPALGVLIVAIVLDILTGLSAAFVTGELNSATSWRGMVRKVTILFVVAFAALIQLLSPLNEYPLAKMVCSFFTVTEGISILENAARCGLPLPEFLSQKLQSLRESEKKLDDSSPDVVVEVKPKKDRAVEIKRSSSSSSESLHDK